MTTKTKERAPLPGASDPPRRPPPPAATAAPAAQPNGPASSALTLDAVASDGCVRLFANTPLSAHVSIVGPDLAIAYGKLLIAKGHEARGQIEAAVAQAATSEPKKLDS